MAKELNNNKDINLMIQAYVLFKPTGDELGLLLNGVQ